MSGIPLVSCLSLLVLFHCGTLRAQAWPDSVIWHAQSSIVQALDTSIRTINWDSLMAHDHAHFYVDSAAIDSDFGSGPYNILQDSEQGGYYGYANYYATQYVDLNHDGREDAIVKLWNPGSGGFATALIFLQTAQGPKFSGWAGGAHFWDAVHGDTLDVITADWLNYDQESQCCPSADDHQRIVGEGDTVRFLPVEVQVNWGWPYWKVELFYRSLNETPPVYGAFIKHESNRRYAYSMLSPSYQASHPYNEWLNGFAGIRSISAVIDEDSPDTAVRVTITSQDSDRGTRVYALVWHLKLKSDSGDRLRDWILQMPEIPAIRKLADTPTAYPRLGMSFSKLLAELRRPQADWQPSSISELLAKLRRPDSDWHPGHRSEYFFKVNIFGAPGDLGVGLDSSGRIDSIYFTSFGPDGRDTGVGTTMLHVLQDSLGKPFDVQQSSNYPGTIKFAWHAPRELSYILDTDRYGSADFRTGIWDTSLVSSWNYRNTGHLDGLNLETLATARFGKRALISYLKGKCLHVTEHTRGSVTVLWFSPVFVCGIPGKLWTLGKRWPIDSLTFPYYRFTTDLSFIRSVGDTLAQQGQRPANQRIRSGRALKASYDHCFRVKYVGKSSGAPPHPSLHELPVTPQLHPDMVRPIHANFYGLGTANPGFSVFVRDSLNNIRTLARLSRIHVRDSIEFRKLLSR